ncbi:hypothetical protein QCE63_34855 [Caballeronia sp. LZ065]|uniref:hypothetical protein n=1 Tax=Caballeronia sp. LZ065 TaxID=3038571 RepID=UPI00285B0888|nr:hypothetical protein [Caballeronia sp. LZ065]MDR5784582.1 hypothetical protein [Caballeronia sp. LZ065]
MRTAAFIKQAEHEAQFVDALLRARYALTVHHGMTVLSDDECSPPCALDLSLALKRIDAPLQMAGIDRLNTQHHAAAASAHRRFAGRR